MPDNVLTTRNFEFFWGGWPSQWFKSDFVIDGITYNCCEQFMMAEKARVFGDPLAETNILATQNPGTQKSLGRQVRHFDPEVWNGVCRGIVYRANVAKYEQDPELNHALLETGDRTLVEASPSDRIWGIGLHQTHPDAQNPAKWRGRNWLGIAITQARDEINRRAGHSAPDFDSELRTQINRRRSLNPIIQNP